MIIQAEKDINCMLHSIIFEVHKVNENTLALTGIKDGIQYIYMLQFNFLEWIGCNKRMLPIEEIESYLTSYNVFYILDINVKDHSIIFTLEDSDNKNIIIEFKFYDNCPLIKNVIRYVEIMFIAKDNYLEIREVRDEAITGNGVFKEFSEAFESFRRNIEHCVIDLAMILQSEIESGNVTYDTHKHVVFKVTNSSIVPFYFVKDSNGEEKIMYIFYNKNGIAELKIQPEFYWAENTRNYFTSIDQALAHIRPLLLDTLNENYL
jgi:hypothetical protein